MALLRLTDISLAQSTAITPTTLIHIVTTADTTQFSGGSSYKAELGQLSSIFSSSAIDGSNSRRWTNLNTSLVPLSGGITIRNVGAAVTLDPSLVTNMRISRYDNTTADMNPWFTALDNYININPSKAYIQITDISNNSIFGIYEVGNVGFFTSGGTDYWQINTTYINGSASLFSGGDTLTVSWVLFGADTVFTGGSGNCITDFYVTNIHGCSPINVQDNLIMTGGTTISSSNGGGQIDLDYFGIADEVFISNDNGSYSSGQQLYLSPGYVELSDYSLGGEVNLFSDTINLFSGIFSVIEPAPRISIGSGLSASTIMIGIDDSTNSTTYDVIKISQEQTVLNATTGSNKKGTIISSKGSYFDTINVVNSVILGGDSITAYESNTAYTHKLNIKQLWTGTSITNLGIDANGFVVTGSSSNLQVYTTAFTYNNNTFTISDNSGNTFNATINDVTGLTVNGGLSATTLSAVTIGSSGDCVDDLYVSNIHSCSPLYINPLSEGNVFVGSANTLTVDLTNERVGVGTSTPSKKLEVSNGDALIHGITVGMGGGSNLNNVVLGRNALNSNTSGAGNTSIGRQSLFNNTIGNYNTAIGGGALEDNIDSSHNLAIGFNSLNNLISGSGENLSIGNYSLKSITGGTGANVSIGYLSMEDTTNGFQNVSVGNSSMKFNTTGYNNVSVGFSSLAFNTIGNFNTSIGNNSMLNNTIGYDNVSIGSNSMYYNSNSYQNVSVGSYSSWQLTNGYQNVVLGYEAMKNAVGGNKNIAIGNSSLDSNISGVDNISVGQISLSGNTNGGGNIGIGRNALNVNKTGNYNIAIGYDSNVISSGLTNAIAIGYNTVVNTSNSMVLGNGVNVGIGTSSPSSKLEVSGRTITTNFTMTSGATNGYVLTSDASGNASWSQSTTFTGGTVTGATIFTNGVSANTISATTYQSTISNTQVVYSNNGTLTGSTAMTWTNSATTLSITGTLEATSKSFVIPHPTKEGKKLVYGSLEGPENGVYHRGKLTNENTILLPEYWSKLVDKNTVTVNLTPIGRFQNLYVKEVLSDKIIVDIESGLFGNKTIECYYTVYGERKDTDKLIIER